MSLNRELLVFLAALAPVIEVRGSVPLGILLGLSPFTVVPLSIIASLIPVIPLLWFLNNATQYLRKINFLDKFFEWLFARTRSKSNLIERFEVIGLIIFIGIPFPGTGVWTGCVAAYLLGFSRAETFLAAALGSSIAALIMLLVSLGVINLF